VSDKLAQGARDHGEAHTLRERVKILEGEISIHIEEAEVKQREYSMKLT
jgi:hypothetical protein